MNLTEELLNEWPEAADADKRPEPVSGGGGEGAQAAANDAVSRATGLAREGRFEAALAEFRKAAHEAEAAGEEESAALAALAMIEECRGRMAAAELRDAFERAVTVLSGSRAPGVQDRLIECTRLVIEALSPRPSSAEEAADEISRGASARSWEGFSLKQQVLDYEAELIARALKDAGGSVSRAARLLGFKHHNNLVAMLNTRHRELLTERTPPVPRRRSIISRDHPGARRRGA